MHPKGEKRRGCEKRDWKKRYGEVMGIGRGKRLRMGKAKGMVKGNGKGKGMGEGQGKREGQGAKSK